MTKIELTEIETEELKDLLTNCLYSENMFINQRIAEIVLTRIEDAEDEFFRGL